MATQSINVPAKTWVKITNVSKNGTIRLRTGRTVFLTEQTSTPTQDAPISNSLVLIGDVLGYLLATNESVWAYSDHDAILDVSPVGVL